LPYAGSPLLFFAARLKSHSRRVSENSEQTVRRNDDPINVTAQCVQSTLWIQVCRQPGDVVPVDTRQISTERGGSCGAAHLLVSKFLVGFPASRARS
jgi:hypothetical protein